MSMTTWQATDDGEYWYDVSSEDDAKHYRWRRKVDIIEVGETKYDNTFGDDRECDCGHTYYRHFDGYENGRPGCKYCSCVLFKEKAS